MKRFLKGFGYWAGFNGLYAWAVYSACIMLSPIGYNYLIWSTGVLLVLQILSLWGISIMKNQDREKYQKIADDYNKGWHINQYVDVLYSVVVLSAMLYGGFLGIATMYLTNEVIQFAIKGMFKEDKQTIEEIESQYDDSILDRLGINQNERGR